MSTNHLDGSTPKKQDRQIEKTPMGVADKFTSSQRPGGKCLPGVANMRLIAWHPSEALVFSQPGSPSWLVFGSVSETFGGKPKRKPKRSPIFTPESPASRHHCLLDFPLGWTSSKKLSLGDQTCASARTWK